jgi:DNA primase
MASIDEAKEIIKSTAISTVITYYHPISKKGGNFEGVCPFHADTNPSMKINDDKGIYKCFVCGAAGDAIKFVQDRLNLDFIEAVKDISEQLGISIDEFKKRNQDPKFEMALRVLTASNKMYRKVANEVKPEAFTNFIKSRNLNEESIQNFQLGYAPGKNAMTKYLESVPEPDGKMAMDVARSIGLIRPNKHGPKGHYDFYRDRVTFPVIDHSGKVRGYSSRAVLPDQKPKYLNSGESFIFDKGNILYGFNLAKSHIRENDSVIVVEGNMDAVMLHQFGFKNSVATQGVALSENSIKLLSNMTKNLYLAMDSDNAGLMAMGKINLALLTEGIIAKFISFAPLKDPDDFLNEYGRLELQKRIDEAPNFIDYQISEIIPSSIPEQTDKKLTLLREVFAILAPLKTVLLATEKVIQCAKSLGLKSNSDDIINDYKSFLEDSKPKFPVKKKTAPSAQTQNTQSNNQQQYGGDAPPMPDDMYMQGPMDEQFIPSDMDFQGEMTEPIITNVIPKAQALFLETLLTHPECIESNEITEILDFIDHFEVKRIVQWLKKIYLEIDEADYPLFVREKMKESLPESIKAIMNKSLSKHDSLKLNQKVIGKMTKDLVLKLKIDSMKRQRDALREKQKNCDTDEESILIINEIQIIEKQLLELRRN